MSLRRQDTWKNFAGIFAVRDLLDAPPSGLLSSAEFLYVVQEATVRGSAIPLVFAGNSRKRFGKHQGSTNRA
jgi:hypothetical protein